MKVKKKTETAAFNILPTKAGRRWFFFPSLAEGKNHPLPIRGDSFIRQLGLVLRGDETGNYDNELLPCPVGLARFLPAHGSLSSKQKSCQKGFWEYRF